MRADIAKLRGELAVTQRDQGDALKLIDSRLKHVEDGTFKQNAERSLEKDKLLTEVEQLKAQLEDLQSTKSSAPAEVSTESKADLVAQIKTSFEDKSFEKAIAGCDAFLTKYAGDKQFSPQVLYWRGDSYYELGEYKKAVLSFQELLTKYQNFSKIPEALYKVGLSLEALKFKDDAAVFYNEIIEKHAKSPFAAKAKDQLKKRKK